ncbi:GH1 family beta-glucosidase [Thermus antranikianii]|uniref:GH1 family beta-glucosidase n=1 Tax=Thermus antranikianii TaxID=88190 RepID=UPI0019BD8D40|nr:GH1 family beta-glucosidase [Thermus antranikianii]QWK21418.1 MAG: beta-glucosidase [Thermus antranikianii]
MTVNANSFLFGVATSAYQIEGGTKEDGRGPSIWDAFAQRKGTIRDGSTGEPACDHYRRWREDLALMKELGIGAYRFSIAWPRVLPEGKGRVNPKGLAFYDRLVDGLLEAGITPFITLYHWDLPLALEQRGGWRSRETAYAFAQYAELVARSLGDRVPFFATLNEPWCSAFLGHFTGEHAPGLRNLEAALRSAHHLLLAHGLAVKALRASGARQVGIVLNFTHIEGEDREAVARADAYHNRFFLDPLLGLGYPQGIFLAEHPMPIQPGDMEIIAAPIDFLGVNYYTRARVAPGEGLYPVRYLPPKGATTSMGWEVYPEGLYLLLRRLSQTTPWPLYVTENGAAYPDRWRGEEVVEDPERVAYLQAHLEATLKARREGGDIRGYFVWSLLDNFEWAQGYTQRFGLFYVDYPSQRRIPKRSALWYQKRIAEITADP